MHIVIAPFRLKEGIDEDVALKTSDDFQDGILQRILVKDGDGGYADVVFFQDAASFDRVTEAEQNSNICATFFAIMDGEEVPRVYQALKTYQ
jgi:hypothetical protein